MRVLFAGTPKVAVPSLDAIVAAGYDVVAVLTRPAAPSGRGRKLVDSPVAARAHELGLRVLAPAHPRDPEFGATLREVAPDVAPVVAYGALLPADVLAVPRNGWVNLHFSVLPRWRGAAPLQRGIIAGDPTIGATTFQIIPALDAGPIYRQHSEPMSPDASAGELLDHLAQVGAGLLVDTLTDIAAGVTPTAQDEAGITLAAKLTTEGAQIDWSAPAATIHNHVRGHSPDPGAWTMWRGQRLKVLRTRATDETALAPGALRVEKRRVLVGTGDGVLELLAVQPVGKKPMGGADWGRGGVRSGEELG